MSFNTTNPSTTSSYYDGSQYIAPSSNQVSSQSSANDYLQKAILQAMNGSQNVPTQSLAASNQVNPIFGTYGQSFQKALTGNGWNQYQLGNQYAQQYGQATQAAYNNPLWDKANNELMNVSPMMQQANGLAQNTMSGQYLNPSSYLKNAIQSAQGTAERNAADQNAMLRSKMAGNGMSFSTADQQAQMASAAAQRSNATNAATQAYAQNYAQERQNQNQAVNQAAALQAARNAQLGTAAQMQGQRAGLMQYAGAAQMQPFQSYQGILDSYKAGTQGVENIQQKTPLDYAMLLASIPQPNTNSGYY